MDSSTIARALRTASDSDRRLGTMVEDNECKIKADHVKNQWEIQSGKCFYCSVSMNQNERRHDSNAWTLDLYKPCYGHSIGNIALACSGCTGRRKKRMSRGTMVSNVSGLKDGSVRWCIDHEEVMEASRFYTNKKIAYCRPCQIARTIISRKKREAARIKTNLMMTD